jgi:hypothetical protein
MTSTTKKATPILTVGFRESDYGTMHPQITVTFPEGMTYRAANAYMHRLAASVELESEGAEWIVNLSAGAEVLGCGRGSRAILWLELFKGTDRESVAGHGILEAVAYNAETHHI